MGAWGVGTFDNDDAGDWVYQLEEADDAGLVQDTLLAAAEPEGYLDAPTSAVALAAAEVVAALSGQAAPDLPEEVRAWVGAHRTARTPDLRVLAVRAIDQVAADSELKDLWAESDDAGAWTDRLQELRGRLAP